MRVHMFPAESVTEVIGLVAPVYTLADSTKRWPLDVAVGKEPLNEVAEAVSVPLADWTRLGVVPEGAVTVKVKVAAWTAEVPVPVTVTV